MIDTWRKASFSGTNGCVDVNWRKSSLSAECNCVEVNHQSTVKIRNSNHPDRGTLEFDHQAMSSWIKGIKNSEFDNFV